MIFGTAITSTLLHCNIVRSKLWLSQNRNFSKMKHFDHTFIINPIGAVSPKIGSFGQFWKRPTSFWYEMPFYIENGKTYLS